jgi:outer membrane protein OmpA-like peptidoglycan-associated protein
MPDHAAPDHGAIRFITDAWPLLALGMIGALIIRACAPIHPASPAPGPAAAFDVPSAVRAGNAHAMASLDSLTPQSRAAQVLDALNLAVIDFADGGTALPEAAEPVLTRVAAVIAARPAAERFEISGHTDATASPLADLELSRRRAQAVVDFLVNQGVSPQRLQARGDGDQDPVASEATAEARFRNRRLQFALLPEKADSQGR